ncbi:hypothetical protein OESDEN_19408 [Oesophagostomum dentatum]|uniref:Uncharacterized protein n=1 Tax=Oesophagostomum dentatum TaxID=61180 RepID=A0A0B1SBH4_OESDE|nr:hypothetical protein OESDEN_19408 [Oesophagostomum dentatum]
MEMSYESTVQSALNVFAIPKMRSMNTGVLLVKKTCSRRVDIVVFSSLPTPLITGLLNEVSVVKIWLMLKVCALTHRTDIF